MTADESLKDVERFIRAHLDADAALSRAALSEPSDDVYLEKEREAKAFYASGNRDPYRGESFDIDNVEHVTLLQKPKAPAHAAFLRRWGS